MLKAAVSLALAAVVSAAAADNPPERKSAADVLKEAPADAWRSIDQRNLVYITLKNGNLVVIELAEDFAPRHAEQIRLLAAGRFFDGLSVYRVQDNFVAQFGDADGDNPAKRRKLPRHAAAKLAPEFARPLAGLNFVPLEDKEPAALSDQIGYAGSFPVAVKDGEAWIPHCYGMVGAARNNEPDSSTASELYVVIGQPARNLDRQITVVGRVVAGIEHLAALPRGNPNNLGFYDKAAQRVPILSLRLGSELPKSQQTDYQTLRTDSRSFKDLEASRKRMDGEWYARETPDYQGVCDLRASVRVNPASLKTAAAAKAKAPAKAGKAKK